MSRWGILQSPGLRVEHIELRRKVHPAGQSDKRLAPDAAQLGQVVLQADGAVSPETG
ncbi:hypothetical protein [Meiothermus sp. CFH 77666]|uniref:hypothetical protein n=1 Tax=Meiothermus sp. CFH 77666 TaxID=2817942 RepID=UPI001AA04E1F|nr:hypothetical protein [Meiothermus sp. CFH 77666]MBO1438307.1 hypothetical protein [Meiothermus sp. CFH 77666]